MMQSSKLFLRWHFDEALPGRERERRSTSFYEVVSHQFAISHRCPENCVVNVYWIMQKFLKLFVDEKSKKSERGERLQCVQCRSMTATIFGQSQVAARKQLQLDNGFKGNNFSLCCVLRLFFRLSITSFTSLSSLALETPRANVMGSIQTNFQDYPDWKLEFFTSARTGHVSVGRIMKH